MERRSYPRVPVLLKAKFNSHSDTIAKSIEVNAFDLSCSGIGFKSESDFPLKTNGLIKFTSSITNTSFHINGELIRKKMDKNTHLYEYGFQFYNDETEIIISLINTILNKQIITNEFEGYKVLGSDVSKEVGEFFKKHLKLFISQVLQTYNRRRLLEIKEESCQDEIIELCNGILPKLETIESKIKNVHTLQLIKHFFRTIVGNLIYQSKILKRANDKPKGYPEDFFLRDLILSKKIISDGVGFYLDNYFLSSSYAQTLKAKTDAIQSLLTGCIENAQTEVVDILSFANSPCTEIDTLFKTNKPFSKILSFEIVDQDEDGLAASESHFLNNNFANTHNALFYFRHKNILHCLNDSFALKNDFLKKDLIYSLYINEFLPDTLLVRLLQLFLTIVKKKGSIVLSFIDSTYFNSSMFDWYCDWHFVKRTEKNIERLVTSTNLLASNYEYSITKDSVAKLLLLRIDRKK